MIEATLQGRYDDVLVVLGAVNVNKGCPRIDHVGAAFLAPHPRCHQAVKHGHHGSSTVHHGGVNDLPLPRAGRLQKGCQQPQGEIHPAAAEVADEIQGIDGLAAPLANAGKHSRKRNVIGIVACGLGQRTFLTPTCHAPVNQPGVDGKTVIGAKTQPFHGARPKALEQGISLLAQPQYERRTRRALQIHDNGGTASVHEIETCRNLHVRV